MKTLYDALREADPSIKEQIPVRDAFTEEGYRDVKDFADKVLGSAEFRKYILNGLVLGDIPPAILCRIMDYGWGKPPERLEHTGKDGQPIAHITEVRRIIVRAGDALSLEAVPKYSTH